MTVVMKFGGAAVRDGPAMQNVASIVLAAPATPIVVTSAMEGVSDRLADAAVGVMDEAQVLVFVESLRERHETALAHVAPSDEAAAYALRKALERLERLLYGIAYTQESTPRLSDLVQSFGERLSAPILAAAIRAAGRDAVALDAEHAHIRSLGPFGNARPDAASMRAQIPRALDAIAPAIPVLTGFYGIDGNGHPTLFGRGGSDYVASLVAAAVDAERVELWKRVDGFMTADPRVVAKAILVPALGYDEAAELAHFGAKVLHPRAVEPVEAAGIPIHIRNVDAPKAPGSVIRDGVPATTGLVRACAGKDGLALLRLNGPGMAFTPGVARRVFDALAARAINILNMSTSQATFALLLDAADVEPALAALDPLVGGVVQSIEAHDGRSLLCVVGRGLGEKPGSAARILHAVGSEGVNIEMISLGASDIAINFIIKTTSREAALRAVHGAFLET